MSCRARNSTNVKQAALHFGDRKLLPETDSASGGELKHTPIHVLGLVGTVGLRETAGG